MATLVLVGGPPAVGKTTVAPLIAHRLAPCAWLEADDVWRIFPSEVTDKTRALVESNIINVLRSFLEARYQYVLLTWVLHRVDLIERLLMPLSSLCDATTVVHLVADERTLRKRLAGQPERGRSLERALAKSTQIDALPYPKVDTSALRPEEIADRVIDIVTDL